MKVSLREAFSYALKAKNAWKVIGIFLLINLVIGLINGGMQFASSLPAIGIVLMCTALPVVFIFTLLFGIYVYGYILEVADNSRKSIFEVPAVFSDVKSKLLRGLYLYVINFLYSIPVVSIIFAVIMMSLFVLVPIYGSPNDYVKSDPNSVTTLVVILIALLAFAVLIALAVVVEFMFNAGIYRMMSSNYDISKAFQFSKVWSLFKKGMGENVAFLLKQFVMGIGLVLLLVILFVPTVFIFIFASQANNSVAAVLGITGAIIMGVVILFTLVASVVVKYLVSPHMLGQVYRIWDKKGFNKI